MSTNSQYIGMARFNLKGGVTVEQFLQAENAVRQGIIQQQPGYQGRDVFQDAEGRWLIIMRWDSKETCDAWAAIFKGLDEGKTFSSLMDFSSARGENYTLVHP